MAQEKKVTRTIIVGYNYDVLRKNNGQIELLNTIVVANAIRSVKEQKEILKANGFAENDILVKNGVEQKKFEMSEADFMKYATVVADVEETENEPKETEETENK